MITELSLVLHNLLRVLTMVKVGDIIYWLEHKETAVIHIDDISEVSLANFIQRFLLLKLTTQFIIENSELRVLWLWTHIHLSKSFLPLLGVLVLNPAIQGVLVKKEYYQLLIRVHFFFSG